MILKGTLYDRETGESFERLTCLGDQYIWQDSTDYYIGDIVALNQCDIAIISKSAFANYIGLDFLTTSSNEALDVLYKVQLLKGLPE